VYFDNVGGQALEAALDLLNLKARITVCRMISGYNGADSHGHIAAGPRNLMQLVVKRARMEGFLVLDYWDRAPAAMNQLFDGTHRGKLLVTI